MPVLKLETEDGETLDEYEAPDAALYRVTDEDGALICELSDLGGGR